MPKLSWRGVGYDGLICYFLLVGGHQVVAENGAKQTKIFLLRIENCLGVERLQLNGAKLPCIGMDGGGAA